MLVFAEEPTPRLRYVVHHVFERMLGWPIAWAGSMEEFRSSKGPKLYYGIRELKDSFRVPESGRLKGKGSSCSSENAIGSGAELRITMVDVEHDLFASIFHLLSLTDEINATERDAHDRVPATSLLLLKHKAEHLPVIDLWVLQLAKDLRSRFPELPPPGRKFMHVLTVDVDNGLKYAGRPLHRALGATAKDLLQRPGSVAQRWKVRSGAEVDPYANLPERLARVRGRVDRAIAFFLLRGNGEFDHAADAAHPVFRELIASTMEQAEVGLHPSYHSSMEQGMEAAELAQLKEVLKAPVILSRQHFLRWKLPETLRRKVDLGITEEHTLGFTDRVGFRVGTCTPFPWYDMERDEETPLMLWPFQVMDSAVHEQMGVPMDQAAAQFTTMMNAVRSVDGTFVSVWHDRYLSGHEQFTGWPEVMEEVVEAARK